MIIHFNGMPGVGKLTVAEILANKINARLIDNHLFIDLVTTVSKHGSAEYLSLLEKIVQVILEQIATTSNEIFIFTNCLSAEGDDDRKRFDQIRLFAENKHIPYIQVLLTCELEENKRRIVSENRTSKGKLLNAGELERIHDNYTIYHPPTEFAFEIDTTNLSPEAAAEQIKTLIDFAK